MILTTQSGAVHACDRYVGHTQHFDVGALANELRSLGLEVLQQRTWGFPFYSLQKRLTDLRFDAVREGFLEGQLTLKKRLIFETARLIFFLHDLVPAGPQIFIVAQKNTLSEKRYS